MTRFIWCVTHSHYHWTKTTEGDSDLLKEWRQQQAILAVNQKRDRFPAVSLS